MKDEDAEGARDEYFITEDGFKDDSEDTADEEMMKQDEAPKNQEVTKKEMASAADITEAPETKTEIQEGVTEDTVEVNVMKERGGDMYEESEQRDVMGNINPEGSYDEANVRNEKAGDMYEKLSKNKSKRDKFKVTEEMKDVNMYEKPETRFDDQDQPR
jgi:hypothetical protein